MKNRIEWIDIAKGISIILVVYGHSGLNSVPFIGDWFSAFRMPFFFFVSGLLANPTKYLNVSSFLNKRWKTLYRPYFIFSFILLCVFAILDADSIKEKCIDVITFGWRGIALWFIPVLSLTELFYFMIARKITNRHILLCFLVLSATMGYCSYCWNLPNNYNICFVLSAVLFYGVGNMFKTLVLSNPSPNNTIIMLLCIVSMLLSFTFKLNPAKPEFGVNNLQSVWTYPAAFFGTFFMCLLSLLISTVQNLFVKYIKETIKFFGRNSYLVLAFHQIILIILPDVGLFKYGSVQRIVMWIILTLIIKVVLKYIPALIGRQ